MVYTNILTWWTAFADFDVFRLTAADQTSAGFTASVAARAASLWSTSLVSPRCRMRHRDGLTEKPREGI